MNARQQYDEHHRDVKEEIHATSFGFANFLNQSGVTEEGRFVALLLNLVNRRPASAEALRDFMDDQIEQFAQLEADARQFGKGRFPRTTTRSTADLMLAAVTPMHMKDEVNK